MSAKVSYSNDLGPKAIRRRLDSAADTIVSRVSRDRIRTAALPVRLRFPNLGNSEWKECSSAHPENPAFEAGCTQLGKAARWSALIDRPGDLPRDRGQSRQEFIELAVDDAGGRRFRIEYRAERAYLTVSEVSTLQFRRYLRYKSSALGFRKADRKAAETVYFS